MGCPERRDLQLRRITCRSRASRAPVSDADRYRGDRTPLRRGGRQATSVPPRDVRPRGLGSPPAAALVGPRPVRREAALLRSLPGTGAPLRFGAEVVAGG